MTKLIQSIPREIKHDTHLFGTINGTKFDLVGSGKGRPYDGQITTHLKSTSGLVGFSMHLLDDIAIVGYPTFSLYQKGSYDLFKISDGYSYTRSLKFSCGGFMETEHTIKRTKDGVQGEFQIVDAKCSPPEIESVERFVETFIPAGPGKIESFFTVRWLCADESIYEAKVNSVYSLNHDLTLPFPHFRIINIDTAHTDTDLKQEELLVVVSDPFDLAKRL